MTSLKGNLSSVDLANIFQMLSMNQREGTLYIFDGTSKKAIYFGKDGVSFLSRGRGPSDALGRILLRYDKITPEQLAEALERQDAGSGRLLGQVLVEQSAVSRTQIEEALELQIQEEVFSLFIWQGAQFEFVEGPPDPEFDGHSQGGIQRLTFNVNNLIMEAAQRVDEWEWIQSIVSSQGGVFRYTGDNVSLEDPIFTEPYTGKVLSAIDGRRSVGEIVDCSYVNRFEVSKIISLLVESGAVEPVPADHLKSEADRAVAAGDTAQALKFLTRIVELEGDTPEMHRQLAEVYEGEHELEKAAFHYRVFGEVKVDARDVQEAFEVYRRVTELIPTDLAAADRMVEIFAVNPDGLEDHAPLIIEVGKRLAECYTLLGRSSRAIQVLHRVVSLGSDDQELRNRLIQVYMAAGMIGEAVAEYEALAENAVANGDLEEAERIYGKVLSIDKTRDDVSQRLTQVMNLRRRRARTIRNIIASVILIGVISCGAWFGMKWWVKHQETQSARRNEAAELLSDAVTANAPVLEAAERHLNELTAAFQDANELSRAFRAQKDQRAECRAQAQAAIEGYRGLAIEFEGTPAAEQSETEAATLDSISRQLAKREDDAIKRLQGAAQELFERGKAIQESGGHVRDVLESLDLALEIATPCQAWLAGEHGVECKARAQDCRRSIEVFETTSRSVDEMLERGESAAAFEAVLAYVAGFPPPEFVELMGLPIEIVAKPVSARLALDGTDLGKTSPAVVRVPLRKGAVVELTADGFAPAVLRIPPVRVQDPRAIRAAVTRSHTVTLTKAQVWSSRPLGGRINGAAAADADRIYVPTRGSATEILDAATGELVGRLPTRNPGGVHVQPALVGGVAVLPSIDRVVYFFRTRDMGYEGQYECPGRLASDPLTVDSTVILADTDGHLIALDARSRAETWRVPVQGRRPSGGGFVGSPVTDGRLLYVARSSGWISVVHASTGAVEREIRVSAGSEQVALSTGVVLAGDELYAGAQGGRILRIDPATGRTVWIVRTEVDLAGAPGLAGDTVVAVSRQGLIVGLRREDGREVFRHDLGDAVEAAPVLLGGTLYVGTRGGIFLALDVSGSAAREVWTYHVPEGPTGPIGVSSPAVVTETLVIFGATDNTVHAVAR